MVIFNSYVKLPEGITILEFEAVTSTLQFIERLEGLDTAV